MMGLLLGIIGTLIISISSAVISYKFFLKKAKDSYNAKLFFEYKKLAQELVDILGDLLTLSMAPCDYTTEQCNKIDRELGLYFFKYYLVLPQQVLEEMNCLHACLQCGGQATFMIDRTNATPVLRRRTTEDEIKELFMDVAIIAKDNCLSRIYKIHHRMPRYIYLKCQARHVITVLNDCWSLKEFHDWQKRLPKLTVLQREKLKRHFKKNKVQ